MVILPDLLTVFVPLDRGSHQSHGLQKKGGEDEKYSNTSQVGKRKMTGLITLAM